MRAPAVKVMLDSFSGALVDLPKGRRDTLNALAVLEKHPRVSVWDLSEWSWCGDLVTDMLLAGLIEDDKRVPYPWHHFMLTEAGREKLAASKTHNAKVSGAGTASAGLPGYADGGNGERE
jgi:hypothetical protein